MLNAAEDKLSEEGRRILTAAAERRAGRNLLFLGLGIAPLLMAGSWLLFPDADLAQRVGDWTFLISLAVALLSYLRFGHYSAKLGSVQQSYAITVHGIGRPIREAYDTKYHYDQSTRAHFAAHERMHFWGWTSLTAAFAVMG